MVFPVPNLSKHAWNWICFVFLLSEEGASTSRSSSCPVPNQDWPRPTRDYKGACCWLWCQTILIPGSPFLCRAVQPLPVRLDGRGGDSRIALENGRVKKERQAGSKRWASERLWFLLTSSTPLSPRELWTWEYRIRGVFNITSFSPPIAEFCS